MTQGARQSFVFHTREFLGISASVFGLEEQSILARKDGRLVGCLPLNTFGVPGNLVMGSLTFSPAGVVLLTGLGHAEADLVERSLFEAAMEKARSMGCKALTVALPPAARAQIENRFGVSPLDAYGFQAESTSSYVLELGDDAEKLFANFRSSVRQDVRRAEKKGVVVRRCEQAAEWESYYRLHCETYERTGARPHPPGYFEGIFSVMMPRGYCRIYEALLDSEPIAYANVATFGGTALYWTGCGRHEALRMGAGQILQWRAIQDLVAEGFTHYDVGEAFPGHRGDKEAGLDLFKRGFGGDRRPFHKGRIVLKSEARPSRARLAAYYLKQSLKTLAGK